MAVLPTLFLCFVSRPLEGSKIAGKTVYRADDHRDHILVYLFSMLLPFYTVNLNDWRSLQPPAWHCSNIFLFWHLNIHYMNCIRRPWLPRVYHLPDPQDQFGSRVPFVILTKRPSLPDGTKLETYRLNDVLSKSNPILHALRLRLHHFGQPVCLNSEAGESYRLVPADSDVQTALKEMLAATFASLTKGAGIDGRPSRVWS